MSEKRSIRIAGDEFDFEVRWCEHDTLATTAFVTFECYTTVQPRDPDDAIVLNAFTDALSDLIEAFSAQVGSDIAVVKKSLLSKLQPKGIDPKDQWAQDVATGAKCPRCGYLNCPLGTSCARTPYKGPPEYERIGAACREHPRKKLSRRLARRDNGSGTPPKDESYICYRLFGVSACVCPRCVRCS